jgi:uncharacterized protein YjbJ (UPF0337 family)
MRLRRGQGGADTVSGMDRAKNKAQGLLGKAKAAVGKITGDKGTQYEGKADQAKANLKDAGEKAKAAFNKYVPRHRAEARDGPGNTGEPGSTGDGPGNTGDSPKQ